LAEKTVTYEGLFIFDANRFARDREALAKEVEGAITAVGGTIEVSRLWEERRLAYPINGQRKGAYWLMYFQLPTQKVTELTRVCELNDSLLRQLFVRLPEALVEPILEHVRGGGTPEDAPSEVEPEVAAGAAK